VRSKRAAGTGAAVAVGGGAPAQVGGDGGGAGLRKERVGDAFFTGLWAAACYFRHTCFL